MPNIVITERDETTPGVVSESTDVVYIPGFVDITQPMLLDDQANYVGLEVNTPTLFTSVAEFESLCGTRPARFEAIQHYSDLKVDGAAGFASAAVPHDNVMFNEGDVDPAYVMAKELLASGLSVVYERVNSAKATEEPEIPQEPTVTYIEQEANYVREDTQGLYVYSDKEATIKLYTRCFADYDTSESFPQPEDGVEYYRLYSLPEGQENEYSNKKWGPYETGSDHIPTTTEGADWETWCKSVKIIATATELHLSAGYTEIPINCNMTSFVDYKVYKRQVSEPEVPENVTEGIDSSEVSIVTMYYALGKIFDVSNKEGIVDRGNYSIKYLTSGGYPVFEYSDDPATTNTLVTKMLNMAEARGDCVALIDHTNNIKRSLNPNTGNGSVYESLNQLSLANGDFGAMFTPYMTYNRITSDYNTTETVTGTGTTVKRDRIAENSSITAPGSYAYLTSLADSIKTNANWLAIAGVTRGTVRNIGNIVNRICNTFADDMQPREGVSMNAITNIKPYGYVIWGNRTLKNNAVNLVATSFLNIRNLVSDVKKTCYRVARSTTFEQDTDVLWMNFKSSIATTLDRMVSGYGISGYKIVRDNTHEKAKEKATICAKIILYPTYAVEDFYITVVLKDSQVTVE